MVKSGLKSWDITYRMLKALSFVAEWLLLEKSRIYQLCGLGKRTLFCAQNSSF